MERIINFKNISDYYTFNNHTTLHPLVSIHNKIIDAARSSLFDTGKTVNEIAYELGFKYLQHFTRLFKLHTGYTPNSYRDELKVCFSL